MFIHIDKMFGAFINTLLVKAHFHTPEMEPADKEVPEAFTTLPRLLLSHSLASRYFEWHINVENGNLCEEMLHMFPFCGDIVHNRHGNVTTC